MHPNDDGRAAIAVAVEPASCVGGGNAIFVDGFDGFDGFDGLDGLDGACARCMLQTADCLQIA